MRQVEAASLVSKIWTNSPVRGYDRSPHMAMSRLLTRRTSYKQNGDMAIDIGFARSPQSMMEFRKIIVIAHAIEVECVSCWRGFLNTQAPEFWDGTALHNGDSVQQHAGYSMPVSGQATWF